MQDNNIEEYEIKDLIGKRVNYTDYLGLPKEGIIVYIEVLDVWTYVYVKSPYSEDNCYKTTLDGKVPEFSYMDVVVSEKCYIPPEE